MTAYPTDAINPVPLHKVHPYHRPQSFSHYPLAMADMSRATSAAGGFSVYQPALGSPLQFLPAVVW